MKEFMTYPQSYFSQLPWSTYMLSTSCDCDNLQESVAYLFKKRNCHMT